MPKLRRGARKKEIQEELKEALGEEQKLNKRAFMISIALIIVAAIAAALLFANVLG